MTAETREDRFWRLLEEKMADYGARLWNNHEDAAARIVDGLRGVFEQARKESKTRAAKALKERK